MTALFSDDHDDPSSPEIIKVWISKMRQKLKPHGIEIPLGRRFRNAGGQQGNRARPDGGTGSGLSSCCRLIAEFHVKDIPALWAGSLRYGLDRMLIGNARETIPVNLPAASGGAVGCQELRLGLGCGMPVDDVVLGVGQGSECVEGHCGGA
jgi:hypothetical protein